jgi:hypothetical protein
VQYRHAVSARCLFRDKNGHAIRGKEERGVLGRCNDDAVSGLLRHREYLSVEFELAAL